MPMLTMSKSMKVDNPVDVGETPGVKEGKSADVEISNTKDKGKDKV